MVLQREYEEKKATHNDFDMKMQGEKKRSTHILGNVKDRKHINIRCKAKKGKERKNTRNRSELRAVHTLFRIAR